MFTFVSIALASTFVFFFFFNDTPPPEISPLPLPAALPFCEGRGAKNFRRRRRREAVAGDAGGGKAEGGVDPGSGAPAAAGLLRIPAQTAVARRVRRRLRRRRWRACESGGGRQGDLSPPVSDAWVDGHLGRRPRRP